MEDTPLVPRKRFSFLILVSLFFLYLSSRIVISFLSISLRLILTKSVLIAVSVSCLLLVTIFGAVILSHSSTPNSNAPKQQGIFTLIIAPPIIYTSFLFTDDGDTMLEDNFPSDDLPSYTIPCTYLDYSLTIDIFYVNVNIHIASNFLLKIVSGFFFHFHFWKLIFFFDLFLLRKGLQQGVTIQE
jgi:hypothetical protein